jgi:hypothetical protein
MGFLDKLLGREKKDAGDSSMHGQGMHQEQEGMADPAPAAEDHPQGAHEEGAEHRDS